MKNLFSTRDLGYQVEVFIEESSDSNSKMLLNHINIIDLVLVAFIGTFQL